MKYIDLHTHSDFSDGAKSPTDVIVKAKDSGLSTVALTDHDNVEGLREAECASFQHDIDFVRGVEISAYDNTFSNIHIVGLFLSDLSPIRLIQKEIENNKADYIRDVCNCISKKTKHDFSFDAIKKELKGSVSLGTLSFLLCQNGFYPSYVSAFSTLKDMKKEKELPDEPQFRVHISQAIDKIHKAGGIAVLAHPCRLDKRSSTFSEIILAVNSIVDCGIDAIEAFYPNQGSRYTNEVLAYAHKKGILISGGSDFHGQKEDALIGKYPNGTYIMSDTGLKCLQNKAMYYKHKMNVWRRLYDQAKQK